MVVPLSARGRTLGAITFVSAESGRGFGPPDLQLAEDLRAERRWQPTTRCCTNTNARPRRGSSAVCSRASCRRSPASSSPPATCPPTRGLDVGGDWYDVIALPSGEVALVIGDVAGRGIDAATVMGQLRTTIRVYASTGYSPADTIERLNATATDAFDRSDMATVLYLVLDPATSTVRYVNAGHFAPLVLGSDGRVTRFDARTFIPGRNPSLRPRYEAVEGQLPPGATLILFTDGLIERRGEPIDAGLARLDAALAQAPPAFDDLLDALLEQVAPPDRRTDDIALLALRTTPVGSEPLRLTLPAQFTTLASTRQIRAPVARAGRSGRRRGASRS